MILAQTTAPKVPGWPSDGNFLQGHPKPAFSKKVQRGDQEKFFKNRPESSPRLKGLKALWRKWHYSLISMPFNCKDWKIFRPNKRLQKCPNGQVMEFLRGHSKPAFSEKVQMGDQGKFFKIRLKSRPRFKKPRALWCKWHYPVISIHLKCKNSRRFKRKQRLQKCPNGQVMVIFARSSKTPYFLKKCKRGTKENFSEIA